MCKIVVGVILVLFIFIPMYISEIPILISTDAIFIILSIGVSNLAFGIDELYRKKK